MPATSPIHAAASATSFLGRANYLAGEAATALARNLVTGGDDPLLPHIVAHLATADRADILVGFALASGVDRVFEHFRDLLARGGRLRILTGDYLGITEPNARIWGRPGVDKGGTLVA